ncbi:MAG TPA: YceI family protein [Leeuwenhoekiella sp.]|nr:YceI family protein [Leeuwenhoekiella sp.]
MYKWIYVPFIFLFLSNHSLTGQVYGTENGKASFKAKMPLNSYTGESEQLKGSIDFKTKEMKFKVPVKSIKTGNQKRDEHMYDLLEAQKNPNVIFEGNLLDDYDFKQNTAQTVKAKGDFTLAGTTRQITILLDLKLGSEGTIQLTASWSLLITDYNLERPSFTFIKINDKHELNVNALLVEQ